MSKYLELFKGSFNDSINEKTKLENKPYIGYSLTNGVVYTVVPPKEPVIEGPADNEIWYTTQEGVAIEWDSREIGGVSDGFENELVSNTYENGLGKLVLKNPVTIFGDDAPFTSLFNTDETPAAGGTRITQHVTSFTLPKTINKIKEFALRGLEVKCDVYIDITEDQWNLIEKESGWNGWNPVTIHCIDNDIEIAPGPRPQF